jgi:hypothetical protein
VTWYIWAGEVRKWERVVESLVQGLGEFEFDYWKCSEERKLSVSLEMADVAERGVLEREQEWGRQVEDEKSDGREN